MEYAKLGSSDVKVSRVCLGSMTWGHQNNQRDADQQIELAVGAGVNFIDTAEMYPVPPAKDTQGGTERIIGDWLHRNKKQRQDLIIASKITGPGLNYIREGGPVTGDAVLKAVDESLTRLQTDYIDLYQIHWPNRVSPHFARHHPNQIQFSSVDRDQQSKQMLEILQALKQCQEAGKIRHCGLSDETTWGINEYLKLADKHSLPKMVSIQNEFNLLHAKDWPYLIENCVHEDVAFLPWSPLAGGALSGKYLNGQRPEGSRWTISQRNGLFRDTPQCEAAISQYAELAKQHNMTAAQLALLWCDHIDGVTSTIIGATSTAQLQENLDAFELKMTPELQQEVAAIFARFQAPF